MNTNNSACISHLLIPDSEQLQIIVTKTNIGRGGTGTDVRITASRRARPGEQMANKNNSNMNSRHQPIFPSIPSSSASENFRVTRSPGRPGLLSINSRSSPSISLSSGVGSNNSTPKSTENGTPIPYFDMGEETERLIPFLQSNPEFLEDFVKRYVETEVLERWLLQRLSSAEEKANFLQRNGFQGRSIPKGLTVSIGNTLIEGTVRWALARFISSIVYADSFTLFLADKAQNGLKKFSPVSKKLEPTIISIEEDTILPTFVAKRRQAVRMTRAEVFERFPEERGDLKPAEIYAYFLCLPIITADGEMAGVIELYRTSNNVNFTMDDEEVANSYLIWGGIAFQFVEMNACLYRQKRLNEFLLNVVKSIFQDMVSMDSVIKKVMKFAQKLVDADRASLFLLDNKTKELYARIFDLEWEADPQNQSDDPNGQSVSKEIRFALGTGIAGQVAATGKPLSIRNAYGDARFNSSIDKITGYKTRSILCMPVFIKSTVIGVVQMVNKKSGDGEFTIADEEAFETFAVYCGLALHHAKLYDKIRRSEQRAKVAVEILSYHNTCSDLEFQAVVANANLDNIVGVDDFYFPPSKVDDIQKVHYSVYMFIDLFGTQRFDRDILYRFCLTVKKNYRRVPYHNWNHGWTVANAMYCILKVSSVFRPLECLALYIGSLCHDLDHRGKNNKFLADTASPLASIYSTSTMEHHHFNQTVTILQQEGHNIFSQLSSDEYKQVLGNIKHCILATDLALFFPYKVRLEELISKETYSWGVPDHRLLTQAIGMTAADLCASAKPWELQKETVKVIFEEFYQQGDYEKSMGRKPMPMMDRDQTDSQAECQVGFLSGICIPCYDILHKLIPETVQLLDGCQKNLAQWKELAEAKKN